jgi:hypothetical protein
MALVKVEKRCAYAVIFKLDKEYFMLLFAGMDIACMLLWVVYYFTPSAFSQVFIAYELIV